MTVFDERRVRAGGFDLRYREAGQGPPLICLHGAGGLRLSRGHELLAGRHRVVALELPGFGQSPANDRSATMADLAGTVLAAADALGIEHFALWGSSFGGKLALWVAVALEGTAPARLTALVLAAPAAILPERLQPTAPEELPSILYAHPERVAPAPPTPPDVLAKQRALVSRLIGPGRDPELETAMTSLQVPTLVMFGTEDRLTPPELGRHYRRLLPSCALVLVYDAAHALDGDRPEAFAALVGDFLERGQQFVVSRDSRLLYP